MSKDVNTRIEASSIQNKTSAFVSSVALRLENAINQLFTRWCYFENLEVSKEDRLIFKTDFTNEVFNERVLSNMVDLYKMGAISQKTLLETYKKTNYFEDSFDIEAEVEITLER